MFDITGPLERKRANQWPKLQIQNQGAWKVWKSQNTVTLSRNPQHNFNTTSFPAENLQKCFLIYPFSVKYTIDLGRRVSPREETNCMNFLSVMLRRKYMLTNIFQILARFGSWYTFLLTHFWPMLPFYIPWKHQKTFLGDIKLDYNKLM